MKRLIILVLILLFSLNAFAKPTANDVTVAIAAITDSSLAAIAALVHKPPLQLPGLSLYFKEKESLPYALSFENSDIGQYLPVFEEGEAKPGESFFASLLRSAKSPMNDLVLQHLRTHQWERGHAILNGRAMINFGEGATLTSLMSMALLGGGFEPISVAVEVQVAGRRVSEPVEVYGVFLLKPEKYGSIEIHPIEIRINGELRDL